jgi:AmmeMemoRadiSam system protein A
VPGLVTAACGEAPVLVAVHAARALGAGKGVVLRYRHSGQTPAGDDTRVVGYGAVALVRGDDDAPRPTVPDDLALERADEQALLGIAREAIRQQLQSGTAPLLRDLSPRLSRPQGVFVTLKKHGELRGCIGRIESDEALGLTTSRMALAAAFEDPRFPPLAASELAKVEIEVSVLSRPRPVRSAEEVVVGRDGVILLKGGLGAVYLPQVATEQGWGRDTMLDSLCQKGGLPRGCWRSGATLRVFQAHVIGETKH